MYNFNIFKLKVLNENKFFNFFSFFNPASLLPLSPILTNQTVTARSHSPTQQPPSCLNPSVTVVTPSIPQDVFQANNPDVKIQQNAVFHATPATLAVPNLVGKTQAVAASKKAFLQVFHTTFF